MHRFLAFAALLLLLHVAGCADNATAPTPSGELTSADDQRNEWQDVEPIWQEAGAAGRGPFESSVDIKQVYLKDDGEQMRIRMRTEPSIAARFKNNPESGELCDIYIDTDNNPQTGCQDVEAYDYGKINGYEWKMTVPIGVDSKEDGEGPFVAYQLLGAGEDGAFTGSEAVASQSSRDEGALISHDEEAVELSIPLQALGVAPGATIRLLLVEAADPFAKERYSEATHTLSGG